jgi:predicted DNA-binding antitoxin AbrB/MazE fold protein
MTLTEGNTLRARFTGGVLEPLEPLELAGGEEVTLTIAPVPLKPRVDWLTRTAGGWAGLVDCEKLKRDSYESRSLITRPERKL